MKSTSDCGSSVRTELVAQWRAARAAQREAEAAGDSWLAELMAGRLDDLRDLVRYHGMLMFPTGPRAATASGLAP